MSGYKKWIIILLIVLVIVLIYPKTRHQGTFSQEALLEDYDQAVETIIDNNPFLMGDSEAFKKEADEYRQDINMPMDQMTFFRTIAPLIEKVACGHTELILQDPEARFYFEETQGFVPLVIRYDEDMLWIQDDNSESLQLEKNAIISINNLTSEMIIAQLMEGIPSDHHNAVFKEAKINRWFNQYYFDLIGESDQYKIVSKNINGEVIESILPARSKAAIDLQAAKMYGINDQLDIQYIENYAILTLPHFDYYDEASYKAFVETIDGFFTQLKSRQINKLIIDIQGNTGGNPFAANYLYVHIAREPYHYFERIEGNPYNPYYDPLYLEQKLSKNAFQGSVYLLIDGLNFSTAGHLIALVKDHGDATLIGATSGAGYECTATQKEFVLKHTNIVLVTSTEGFRTSVSQENQKINIDPDIVVDKTFEDHTNKRNPAREKAIAVIKANN